MKAFWDQRYASEDYAYGKEPNAFFKAGIDGLPAGRMLLPGEGEGRNAVYAALKGWEVVAIDQSHHARRKALRLADEKGAMIEYLVGDIFSQDTGKGTFDLAGLIFFHLPPEARTRYHAMITEALKPGGLVITEAFHKNQINKATGGPRSDDLLYTGSDLLKDFGNMEVVHLSEGEVMLDEGPHHQGLAHVIRFIGKKL